MSRRNRIVSAKPRFPASICRTNLPRVARTCMKELLAQLVATRAGTFAVLLIAAFLEAYGDSCFQSGLYRASGAARYVAFVAGALALTLYGLTVNTPPWDFGKLLGLYVVLFFL